MSAKPIRIVSPTGRQGECLPVALALWVAKGWKEVTPKKVKPLVGLEHQVETNKE